MNNKIEGVAVRLIKDRPLFSDKKIESTRDAVEVVGRDMEDLDREEVRIIMLDVRGKILGYNIVSVGSLTNSIVSPREIFKPVFLLNAESIILMHSHPSGDPTPSELDYLITERMNKICTLLSISFLDHIIVAEGDNYFSFAEDNLIPKLKQSELDFEKNPKKRKFFSPKRLALSGKSSILMSYRLICAHSSVGRANDS